MSELNHNKEIPYGHDNTLLTLILLSNELFVIKY